MRVLIVGADGMLGNAVWRYFCGRPDYHTVGSIRSSGNAERLGPRSGQTLLFSGDLLASNALEILIDNAQPDAVVNCAALTKLVRDGHDPLLTISANSLLPHRLYELCHARGARFIQVSTDCVFNGERGGYSEDDPCDATDLYGRTKVLGEITDKPDAVTLRTSIIGYEIASKRGLLEWFLAQEGQCKGFTNAYFSGVTTSLLARIIDEYVLSDPTLSGLFHIAGPRISKHDLLQKMAAAYGKAIEIVPDGALHIDRSLTAARFAQRTGFVAPGWDEMLADLARERAKGN